MLIEEFQRLTHYVLWTAVMRFRTEVSTYCAFNLCLTEGYKKGYISFHLFEICDFIEVFLGSGSSSVVEHRLAKARVASSSLVSRSKFERFEGGRMKNRFSVFGFQCCSR